MSTRRTIELGPLVILCASLAIATVSGNTVLAQEQADVIEEINVIGYRSSLRKAIDLKRNAVGVQDSIIAEDIADFPDLNLAEALQRIPGVTITRDASEGRQIALRGLGADFVRTQLNGMEALMTTSSGLDPRGGVSRTRSFDYNVFASELFSQVDVYKTYSADLDEGGIGGTVNLITPKPFSYEGFKSALSIKGSENSRAGQINPRVAGLISTRNETFGALVSVAYSEADTTEFGTRLFSWFPVTYGDGDPTNGADGNIDPALFNSLDPEVQARLTDGSLDPRDKFFHPEGMVLQTWANHRERVGVTTALQFSPSEDTELTLDLLYGEISNDRQETAFGTVGANELFRTISGTQVLTDVDISGDNIMGASYTGVDFRTEGKVSSDKTEFHQVSLSGLTRITDRLTMDAMVGISGSEFEAPDFDKAFLELKNEEITFDFSDADARNRGRAGHFDYGFDTTDPTGWNLQRFSAAEYEISNDFAVGELNFDLEINDNSSITFGGMYKDFTNEGFQYQAQGRIDPLDPATPQLVTRMLDEDSLVPYVAADFNASADILAQPPVGLNRDVGPEFTQPGSDFDVEEETHAVYAQYNLDTVLNNNVRFRANFGLRWFTTDITSEGVAFSSGEFAPAKFESDYSELLPAVNLSWDLNEQTVVRVGASRNISRPTLSDLRAAGNVAVRNTGGTIQTGNPNLAPFKADSFDSSLEYYHGDGNYVSLGVFYKNMDSFIINESEDVPYGETGFPLEFLTLNSAGTNTPDTLFEVIRPVNGEGADIFGVEFAFHQSLDFLPEPWSNLGFVGNVTHASGDTEYTINDRTHRLPLFFLSEWTSNFTVYYETDRWGARVAHAFRDDYLVGTGNEFNVGAGIKATHHLDMSVFYNVTDQIKVVLEATDLTEEPIDHYFDVFERRTGTLTRAGRNVLLGVTVDF